MNKNMKRIFQFIRLFIIILGIVGLVWVALYQFDNRNLVMVLELDEGPQSIFISNDVIAEGQFASLQFDDVDEVKLRKIKFYGKWESVLLKELNYNNVSAYVGSIEQGKMRVEKGGIVFTGDGDVSIEMNASFVEMVQKLSASFLQERLIFMGLIMCGVAIMIIICNAVQERYTVNNWNNHGPVYDIVKFCKDLSKYWQYMIFSAKADLKAEVADSYLNRLWWLLEPFFNMLIYVIVFGRVMGNSIENYATFVYSGLLMWSFFSKTIGYSVKLVRSNKDIVTKVYIPKFVILLSNMILNFMKLVFSMLVLLTMLVVFRIHIGINVIWFFPAYLVMMMLAFGVGMIFLHFGVYVDDLSYAIGILLNMLMFLSGIFYNIMTTLQEPLNGLMLCLNPAAMFVDTMRQALVYNTAANLPILGMWFLIALILCYIGIHIVYKNENSYVKVV